MLQKIFRLPFWIKNWHVLRRRHFHFLECSTSNGTRHFLMATSLPRRCTLTGKSQPLAGTHWKSTLTRYQATGPRYPLGYRNPLHSCWRRASHKTSTRNHQKLTVGFSLVLVRLQLQSAAEKGVPFFLQVGPVKFYLASVIIELAAVEICWPQLSIFT